MLIRWLKRRKQLRELVIAEADALIAAHGTNAYRLARVCGHAAATRPLSDYWHAVAREIASREGREIGLDTATRYFDANEAQ